MGVKPSAVGCVAPALAPVPVAAPEVESLASSGLSTVDLLIQARGGDPRASDLLFQRIVPVLRRWARGRLPAHARELCETDDLVQDTLAAALRNLDEFEPRHPGSLLAYLRLGLMNRMRDEVRRARRRGAPVELPADCPDYGLSPLEQVLGRAELRRYEQALRRLRTEHREAILWRIEGQCSYEELAVALGKPSANAARVAVRRALMRLAKEMSHET
jgi:RNA polymerase sigma-70 factor, ECF subfamily